MQARPCDGDVGEAGKGFAQVFGAPEAEAFEGGHVEAVNVIEELMVELGGGGFEGRCQMGEVLHPLLAGLDLAGDGRLQPEGMAVDIAIGMALGLAAHIVRSLEAHRFGDRETAALGVGA